LIKECSQVTLNVHLSSLIRQGASNTEKVLEFPEFQLIIYSCVVKLLTSTA